MHQLVHDEGRAGHIPAVLHQGNEQVQDHDVREEHQDAAAAGDDAVHDEVLQPAFLHEGAHKVAELQSIGYWPMVKVAQKVNHSRRMKIGKASHLFVTMASIRSVIVRRGFSS